MKIYHIVAAADGRVIGKNNQLPWHFSADLKRFKHLTMGHTLLMGRKTFESIGGPLPGRQNFVLSRQKRGQAPSQSNKVPVPFSSEKDNLRYFNSIEDALKNVRTERCFIIGGADIIKQTIDQVDGISLTQVNGRYEGDAYYPQIPDDFVEISRQCCAEEPKLEFIYYEKRTRKM